MANSIEQQVAELIKRSERILIMPSSPIDGDSLGSAVALYLTLKKLGKEVTVVCSDEIPEVFHFLPNTKVVGHKILASNDFIITLDIKNTPIKDIKHSIENDKVNIIIVPEYGQVSEDNISFNKGNIQYDLIITVDCAELKQLRGMYESHTEMFTQIPVINIDHHISNVHYGKLNYVDIMASSTTELLLPLIQLLEKEENTSLLDEDIATLLLTGIITDTGSFQNANTTPRAFTKASELVGYGARQQEIIQHIYKTKQLTQLKLWGRVLSKIQVDQKLRMVWSVVTQQDFKETGSSEDETGDIIDELMTNAPGAEIVILIKEKSDGSVSGSLRSTIPSVDSSRIAEFFGGGGHTQAAGFLIKGKDIRDAEYAVIQKVKEVQSERLKLVENIEDQSTETFKTNPEPITPLVTPPESVSPQPEQSKPDAVSETPVSEPPEIVESAPNQATPEAATIETPKFPDDEDDEEENIQPKYTFEQ